MLIEHTLIRGFRQANTRLPEVEETITGKSEVNYAETLAPGETKRLDRLWIPCDGSLKALYISASQPVSIQTNSPTKPDDTFELDPACPLLWSEKCGMACPLTVDVDEMHVTNRSTTEAVLQMRVLLGDKPPQPEAKPLPEPVVTAKGTVTMTPLPTTTP